jgi:hypothetical protein
MNRKTDHQIIMQIFLHTHTGYLYCSPLSAITSTTPHAQYKTGIVIMQ